MAKYQVETTNGTYEVETEEPSVSQGSFIGNTLRTAGSDLASIPSTAKALVTHPLDTIKAGISTSPQPQIPEAQLPQDPLHRFQRFLGGGPNYHPAGADTPVSELAGHALALGATSFLPKVIGKLPEAGNALMERMPQGFSPVPHLGDAVKAAAPDVASGGLKAATGLALAEAAPGPLKWPARAALMYPGMRQVGRGFQAGAKAASGNPEQAVSELPSVSNANPAVFGDPEGFAKLPTQVQEAIRNGGNKVTPISGGGRGGLPPRDPSHYGITPQEIPPAKTLGPPAAPAEHPPFAKDRPFSPSRAARQQAPQPSLEELGVHGGVENTPVKPLNTPAKLKAAQALKSALQENQ